MSLVAISKMKEKMLHDKNITRTSNYINNLNTMKLKIEEATQMKDVARAFEIAQQAMNTAISETFVFLFSYIQPSIIPFFIQ